MEKSAVLLSCTRWTAGDKNKTIIFKTNREKLNKDLDAAADIPAFQGRETEL